MYFRILKVIVPTEDRSQVRFDIGGKTALNVSPFTGEPHAARSEKTWSEKMRHAAIAAEFSPRASRRCPSVTLLAGFVRLLAVCAFDTPSLSTFGRLDVRRFGGNRVPHSSKGFRGHPNSLETAPIHPPSGDRERSRPSVFWLPLTPQAAPSGPLVANGKAKKIALIALMRTLIIVLNRFLKNLRFEPDWKTIADAVFLTSPVPLAA